MRNRKRIALGAVGATVALAAAVGVAGAVTILTPASADQPAAGTARGETVVTFTEGAVSALGPLSPAGARPGAFGLSPSGLAVEGVFPIVGNSKNGVIDHVGGLTLRDGSSILTLRNYKIDTNTGVLTANGFANGSNLSRIDFLNVTPTAAAPGCAVSANLTLAKPAADALTLLFGAPDLTGAAIGTACVNPR